MTLGRVAQDRLLWIFTMMCLVIACLRLALLVFLPLPEGRAMSWDLRARHEELRLLEQGHYPRSDILFAEGVTPSANTVYPPNAFPWLWLLSPFGDFRWSQLWHGAWSLASLALVLRFAWGIGAATSRVAGLACVSGVLAVAANFFTFKAGQYGLVELALMLGATLTLYRGRSRLSGLLFGISLFKPTNAVMMAAMFLCERRYAGLAIAAIVVMASAAAVSMWSGHSPIELLTRTYPPGGARFTGQGYSLVTLISALGIAPRTASIACAAVGFAGLFYALRFVDGARDPLLVLALVGFVMRISMYHRGYDDLLLVFLLLACLRLWIATPSLRTTAVTLALLATLQAPRGNSVDSSLSLACAVFAIWTCAMIVVLVQAPARRREGEPPC